MLRELYGSGAEKLREEHMNFTVRGDVIKLPKQITTHCFILFFILWEGGMGACSFLCLMNVNCLSDVCVDTIKQEVGSVCHFQQLPRSDQPQVRTVAKYVSPVW